MRKILNFSTLLLFCLTFTMISCTDNEKGINDSENIENVKLEFLKDDINLTLVSKNSIKTFVTLSDHKETPTEVGLEYSTNVDFTDSKTSSTKEPNQKDSNSYFVEIEGLKESTTYYVRAFAKFQNDKVVKSKSKTTKTLKGVI